ncbi:hypothetical protein [Methylomagnum ishizawai]|uniref:hypothetical protein n=1 Tax=Methylomagnum ishizawai TaxID=1760988 RepID=UPI001C33A487|nr:hypothetical protein [Methylomagnum ishizawai]BBL73183.1 hypothetical protein MishRS11D_02810 [Methylomagnum ishizawai]BBL75981.1 hypothetical protein MishRS11D_30790 [Methylomagnum ishizawai]
MSRPPIPDPEKHQYELFVKVQEADWLIINGIAKKKGIPRNVVARALIRKALTGTMSTVDKILDDALSA